MDVTEIQRALIQFRRARSNLLLMVAFTTVSMFLMTFGYDIYMLYSAVLPRWMVAILLEMVVETGDTVYYMVGLFLGLATVLPYLVLGLLAKRFRSCILPAFLYYTLDTLFLLILAIGQGFWMGFIPDLFFHGILFFILLRGVCAWWKLRWVDSALAAQVAAQMQGKAHTAARGRVRGAATEMFGEETLTQEWEQPPAAQVAAATATTTMFAENRTNPLRLDDKMGRTLVAAEYNGMEISMKRSWALTELIVDGYVYDEVQSLVEMGYTLAATVQGVRIVGTYNPLFSRMVLSADGKPIAKKLRFF